MEEYKIIISSAKENSEETENVLCIVNAEKAVEIKTAMDSQNLESINNALKGLVDSNGNELSINFENVVGLSISL